MGCMATQDWQGLVNDAVCANWRETLVMLCTYAPDHFLPSLCGKQIFANFDIHVECSVLGCHTLDILILLERIGKLVTEQLGDRLRSEEAGAYKAHAMVCYVCAGSQDRAVDLWYVIIHGIYHSDTIVT